MFKQLLTPAITLKLNLRSFGQHNKKHIYKRSGPGQKYEGVLYYPR